MKFKTVKQYFKETGLNVKPKTYWSKSFEPYAAEQDGFFYIVFPEPGTPREQWEFRCYGKRGDLLWEALTLCVEAYYRGECNNWQKTTNTGSMYVS